MSLKNNERTRAAENRVAEDCIPIELESDVLVKLPHLFLPHGEVENLVCVSLPTFSRNHLSMIVT